MLRITNTLSSLFDGEITIDYIKYRYLKSLVNTNVITTLSLNSTQAAAYDGIDIKPLNEIAASNIIRFVVSVTLYYEHYNALMDRYLNSGIEIHENIICILLADKLCVHHHVMRHLIALLVASLVPLDDSRFECPSCNAIYDGTADQAICMGCGLSTCYILTEVITERKPERNQLLTPAEYEALHAIVEKYYDDTILLLLCQGLCKLQKPSSFERILMKAHMED